MRAIKRLLAIGLAVLLSAAVVTSAATWTGLGDGANWGDQDNWDTASVPGQYDYVSIGGSAVVNYNVSGNLERSADWQMAGDAALTISGKRFLNGRNNPCTFTMNENARLTHSGDYFIIGTGRPGTIIQNGGTLSTILNRGFFVNDNSNSSGSAYHLNGGVLNVNFVAQGDDWFNELLGRNQTQGMIYVNGGQANFSVSTSLDRRIYIKGSSVLQLDRGSMFFNGFKWFSLGRGDAGEARMIINGGAMSITSRSDGAVIIGGENAQGRLTITGGRLEVFSPNGLWLGDGNNAKRGIVEQTGGDVFVETDVYLGRATSAADTYYLMDGGTLTARDIILHENADPSVEFIFNAGLITLAGDRTSLVTEAWFNAAPGTVVEYDAVNDVTTIARLPYAHNPVPANGQVDVGNPVSADQVEVTLGWKTGLSVDPDDNPGLANQNIITHKLYLSTGDAADPNLFYVDDIAAGSPVAASAAYGPLILDMDKTYLWRVDEITDANTITGPVWSFTTPHPVPLIGDIAPAYGLWAEGQEAAVTVNYSSASTAITGVTWYFNGAPVNPADANISIVFSDTQSTLTILSMTADWEGTYYCVVSNAGGDSDPSASVIVEMKQLVASYAFEGDVTDTAGDSDGTLIGDPNYVDGRVGQALLFDGIEDAVSIPRSIQNSFTIEMWVKTTASGGTGGWWEGRGLVDGEMPGSVGDFGTVVRGSKFGFGVGSPDTTLSSATDINDDQWHYCVATRDSLTGEMKVYVDGRMEASVVGPTGIRNAPPALRIGSIQTGGNFLAGLIDEVKLYNYPVDEATIVSAYHILTGQSVCVQSQKPDARFDMNGDCVVDLSDFAEFVVGWLECGLYPVCQ